MNTKKLFLLATIAFSTLILSGCADTGSSDAIPPSITLYSPASGDTVKPGRREVIYDAYDDQGIKRVELLVNDILTASYDGKTDGTRPTVYWDIDSTQVGKRVSLQLKIYDLGNNMVASNKIDNIFVGLNPPSAPYNLTVLTITSDLLNLRWSDSSKFVTKYEVWRAVATTESNAYVLHREVTAKTFNMNDTLPGQGIICYYKIRTISPYGTSSFSNIINSLGGQGSVGIIPPTNLTATALGTQKIRLNWRDNSDNENFMKVQRKSQFSSLWTDILILPPNTVTTVDSTGGLSIGVDYNYRVGVFTGSDSAYSSTISARPYSYDMNAPSALTAVWDTAAVGVKLTWKDNSIHETINIVERQTGATGGYVEIETLGSDITTFTDKTVVSGQLYFYRILASDGTLVSSASNSASIKIP